MKSIAFSSLFNFLLIYILVQKSKAKATIPYLRDLEDYWQRT